MFAANRDPDQEAFHVHSNLAPYHKFQADFAEILQNPDFETDLQILSCNMIDHFDSDNQPKEEFERKMDFCAKLKNVISKHNPTWLFNIVPTGSTVTGLATRNSDLDVTIHIPQAARIIDDRFNGQVVTPEKKMFAWREMQLSILQIVRLILKNDDQIKNRINWDIGIQLVQAQIQILKLETVDGIECDISVVMELFLSSMHNSFMIRHFHHIDHRFGPLCAVVKEWGASSKVKNPKDGGFNSYALVLLVIHFLQCGTSPPILPNLIEIYKNCDFIAKSDEDFPLKLDFGAELPFPLPEIQKNLSTVSQLFMEFLHYYLHFNFNEKYISIRDAAVKNRRHAIPGTAVCSEKRKDVYIEDPFDSHNPGRTVRSLPKIKGIMRTTLNMFNPLKDDSHSRFQMPSLDNILKMNPEKPKIREDVEEGVEEQEFTNRLI